MNWTLNIPIYSIHVLLLVAAHSGLCGERLLFDKKLSSEFPLVPTASEQFRKLENQLKPHMKDQKKEAPTQKSLRSQKSKMRKITECEFEGGNLPKEYRNICHSTSQATNPVSIIAQKQQGVKLTQLRLGDKVTAYIEQSIKASPNLPTPVVARIRSGALRGSILHGYAKLDPLLKRVIFEFEHLRIIGGIPGGSSTYKLMASGHALNGQLGVEGDYNSGENKYVATAFAVDFATAMLDTSVQRNTTIYGNQVPDQTSISNRLKQSASVATAKEGERLLEKARSAPEWTEIPGGQEIQVIINSDVIEEINN